MDPSKTRFIFGRYTLVPKWPTFLAGMSLLLSSIPDGVYALGCLNEGGRARDSSQQPTFLSGRQPTTGGGAAGVHGHRLQIMSFKGFMGNPGQSWAACKQGTSQGWQVA